MRSALRSFVGPVVLATGVWCAAGVVALPSVDALSARIVVLPPWWLLLAALGAAWLVPSCRRSPLLSTPALLSLLPWLPVRLPTFALIWTGRLAWVPVGLALIAIVRRGRPESRAGDTRGEWDQWPWFGMASAAVLTTLALVATAWALSPRLPGGDEPHYLIITQSLLEDGDLRIENNHQARDYASYFHGTLNPDFLHRGRNEVIYSIHAPGLPVLVAPLFAGFGYRGAQATVMLCAVLTGLLVWACGWFATGSESAAWFGWAAIASSLTFLVEGVSIFPDGPAATVVAASTLVLLWFDRRIPVKRGTLVALSAGLAALPFLHTRLATVSAGVGAAVVWSLAIESGRSGAERRGRILAFMALPAAGVCAWLGYFQIVYGTPNPAVAYGTHPETRLAYIPGGVLGLFFDQDFGALAFAPVLGAAVVGWVRRDRGVASGRAVLIAVALYLGAVGTYWMWWAGIPATPARFAAAILPVLAPGLAGAWMRSGRLGRTVLTSLVAMTMAVSVVTLAVGRGALAWNTYDAHVPWLTWLETSTDLARGLPSFFWDLNPGVVRSEWPFAQHVLALLVVLLALALFGHRAARRSRVPEALAVWVVAGGLMVSVQCGWWMTSATPVQPTGGQLRVLRAMALGRSAWLVSAADLTGRAAQPADVRLDVPRAELARSATVAWVPLADVPGGVYDVTILERRPVGGVLTVKRSDGTSLSAYTLERRSEQTVRLTLPASVSSLSVEPDSTLADAAQRLSFRLVSFAVQK